VVHDGVGERGRDRLDGAIASSSSWRTFASTSALSGDLRADAGRLPAS
jgi:hypothetical protein